VTQLACTRRGAEIACEAIADAITIDAAGFLPKLSLAIEFIVSSAFFVGISTVLFLVEVTKRRQS
jgi:hypothetical protein